MSDAPDSKLAWIDAYLAHLRGVRQLSPHTVAAYARDLQELATLSGALDWTRIDQHAIRRLTAKLHAQQLDPRSIARKLSSWRGFSTGSASRRRWRPTRCRRARAETRQDPAARLSVDDAVQWWRRRPRRRSARTGRAVQPRHVRTAVFERLAGVRTGRLDLTPAKDSLAGGSRQPRSHRHRQGQQAPHGAGRQAALDALQRGWRCARRPATAATPCS
jgi:integrase/recombinase XerC